MLRHLFPQHNTDSGFSRVLRWAFLETTLFCVLAIALRLWITPEDPFGLDAQFPWLWIIPALLAMRYGTAMGVLAVLFVLGSWLVLPLLEITAETQDIDFPKIYFMGGLLLTLVCGQFSDMWNAHIHRLRVINAYLDERLGTLTKNHYLLRLSHDRLEQDLLAKPLTLRETLLRLRKLASLQTGSELPCAQEFIQLLGQHCQLEIAALYGMAQNEHFANQAVATLGAVSPLAIDDPLVQYCAEHRSLAHVQTAAMATDARDQSQYLIAAPLLTSQDKLVGLLVVEKLPFFALNDGALQQLSVFAGFYADGVSIGHAVYPVLQAVPDCPIELALDIVRLHRIKVNEGVESTLVVLVFEQDAHSQDIYEQVKRMNRGLDINWHFSGKRHNALLTLLTLAGSTAVDGFLHRIETAIVERFHMDFIKAQITVHVQALGLMPPAETLQHLVERCEI